MRGDRQPLSKQTKNVFKYILVICQFIRLKYQIPQLNNGKIKSEENSEKQMNLMNKKKVTRVKRMLIK